MLLFSFAGLLCLTGCAAGLKEGAKGNVSDLRVAVYPVENLSGTPAPLKEIRGSLIDTIKSMGFQLLDEDLLQKFMARHRIRYTGGLDGETAKAFKDETGVGAVLVTSVSLYSPTDPPKFGLTSRLVSTGEKPEILWMDSVSLAGDDSPGILGLGMIEDPKLLREKAVRLLGQSLVRSFLGEKNTEGASGKFRPRVSFRSPAFDPKRRYTVAVVPFFNRSDRKNAAEMLALLFVQHLRDAGNISVIEPGLIREVFLESRLIMDQGLSLPNAEIIFKYLDADLILTGYVMNYQDYQGTFGKPKVDFFVSLLESKSKEVVWSSNSYNEGDDGVFFFDFGRVNTAGSMASQMTRSVVTEMVTK